MILQKNLTTTLPQINFSHNLTATLLTLCQFRIQIGSYGHVCLFLLKIIKFFERYILQFEENLEFENDFIRRNAVFDSK